MLSHFSILLADAFAAQGLDRSLAVVRTSDRPDLADLTCIGAKAFAKRHKIDADELAAKVIASASLPEGVTATVENGHINLTLGNQYLAKLINEPPVPHAKLQIVLDYGGPNVAKPLHVGHLRSFLIGESLKRILRFDGHTVTSDIHWGDWGFQMGLLIAYAEEEKIDIDTLVFDDFSTIYPAATARSKTDAGFRTLAQQKTVALQIGDTLTVSAWRKIIAISNPTIRAQVKDLGVDFELWNGESRVNQVMRNMESVYLKSGVIVKSDDALVIPMESGPPLIFKNSEGGYLYGASDLATITERTIRFPDAIIYVVDQRQASHFKSVFAAYKKLKLRPVELEHAGFGTVNGPDGKPLKTRDGGTPTLSSLIDEAIVKASERSSGETARMIALAALKFADLQNRRSSSYIFDLDRFISFEGKTGPYVLYQAVRMSKALQNATLEPGDIVLVSPEERALGLILASFPDVIAQAVEKREPSMVADHAYALAQGFSSFYKDHRIADSAERIALVIAANAQLRKCLDLLTIEVPEEM